MNPLTQARMPWCRLVLCCLMLQGCEREDKADSSKLTAEGVRAAGYTKAVRTSGMVARAVALCNQVLAIDPVSSDKTHGFKLVDGWQMHAPEDKAGTSIPVFLIHSPHSETPPNRALAWIRVPEGRAGIIVEEEAMDEALNGTKAEGSETTLALKGEESLAVMLLHETGHIANGDYGAFAEAVPPDLSSLNLNENIEKSCEFQADAFAARAIASAMKSTGGEFEARITAMSLSLCLSSWSFNLSKERLLDNFGATALNRPAVFWDKGNSHPNMELRVLTIQHLLIGNQTSAELLDSFLARRKAGSKEPRILWSKP